MTDLVTGGAGFIGHHLVKTLLEQNRPVRVFDLAQKPETVGPADWHQGSVTDPAAVRRAMTGVARVFHIAGLGDLWRLDTEDYQAVNVEGTKLIAEEAMRARVDCFVHTSTSALLAGAKSGGRGEVAVAGAYTRSKCEAEAHLRRAHRRGLRVVTLRPSAVIGPGPGRMTAPMRMLDDIISGCLPAYLDAPLSFVDVRDLAEAYLAAADRGQKGEAYVIGHEQVRLSAILSIIASHDVTVPRRRLPYSLAWPTAVTAELMSRYITHKPPVASIEGVRLAGRPMSLANRPDHRSLGLSLRPLEQTIGQTVDWLRERRGSRSAKAPAAPSPAGVGRPDHWARPKP
ncbi:MAG: NAD-dependent epimerase/dehydratase family protein [Geminicoccaceae bacterium]